jgi:hypothetical protein
MRAIIQFYLRKKKEKLIAIKLLYLLEKDEKGILNPKLLSQKEEIKNNNS